MADSKISELTAITGANTADDDLLVIVDTSASQTKKITLGELENALAERDFNFGDNDKLTFGAGSDLWIYHDGTDSYIEERNGTGSLYIDATDLQLRSTANAKYFRGITGGAVDLYYDNASKLATTSTGVDVTGTVTADGLTVSASDPFITLTDSDTGVDHEIDAQSGIGNLTLNVDKNSEGSNSGLVVNVKGNQYMRVDDGGDISFYEDTGTTAKFFWDASAESLGIGGAAETGYKLDVDGDVYIGADGHIRLYSSSAGSTAGFISSIAAGKIAIGTDSGSDLVVDRINNRVGIGTSSPSALLDVTSGVGSTRLTGHQIFLTRNGNNEIYAQGASSVLALGTNSTERMRIDSSGNVGIGDTTFAAGKLRVYDNAGNHVWLKGRASDGTSAVSFRNNADDTYNGRIEVDDTNGMRFQVNTAERMRIGSSGLIYINGDGTGGRISGDGTGGLVLQDGNGRQSFKILSPASGSTQAMTLDASGNLLVGTTTYDATNEGILLGAGGIIYSTNTSGFAASLNRKTTDGDILRFQKDGTTVGSIGVANGDNLYISSDDTNDVGVKFNGDGNRITPCDASGADRNGAIDLGESSARFKDLYLSGTIEIENGTGNVGVGKQALNSNTGSNNTAVGYQAGYSNTTGTQHVAMGRQALYSNTTGNQNTAIGQRAMYDSSTGSSNVAVGYAALENNTTADRNTAVGYQAGLLNTTGYAGVFVGYRAGYNSTGDLACFVGDNAGQNSTGTSNTLIGQQAGFQITSGANNTVIGRFSGNQGGLDIRTSSNNIVLSDGDGNPKWHFDGTTWYAFNLASGAGTNTVKFSTVTGAFTYDTSSLRYKDNIRDSAYGLSHVMQMRSAQFEYKDTGRSDIGLIAEELDLIIPELVGKNKDNEPDSVSYDRLVSVLVRAIQEQQATIKELEARITALENA